MLLLLLSVQDQNTQRVKKELVNTRHAHIFSENTFLMQQTQTYNITLTNDDMDKI